MSGRLSVWAIGLPCAMVGGFMFAGVAGAAELPDGRGYEQVSPEEKYGTEVYQPPFGANESNTETKYTFQAAADGSGLALVEGATLGGNESQGYGAGNEYLARRSADGEWSQRLLSPEGAPDSVFEAFTPNLSTAFVGSLQPLSPGAPGYGEVAFGNETYDTLYTVSTSGGEFIPFDSVMPPYRTPSRFGTAYRTAEYASGEGYGCNAYACLALEGASADYTHLLFAANDALTGAAEGRPAAEGGPSPEFQKGFEIENNLYESVKGQLRLVNVLPNGTTHANATFGGQGEDYPFDRNFFSHDISADGSRIFWTDLKTGHIYMREDGARTVEISSTGLYQTASPDGSNVFYTNGSLYEYEIESGKTTDLTPSVTVSQVVGTSEDDEYIYYVDSEDKLWVLHDEVSKQITTTPITANTSQLIKAQVTPDGHSIVFMMEEEGNVALEDKIEVYDASTETLNCASCTPLGTRGALQESNSENIYQPRWISADGAHVFFVSSEGLLPRDVNGERDVYEWERPGTGNCTESNGCVYLLSGGTSIGNSGFLDASESGGDVFIVTRANFDGSDEDGAFDAYDVRLGAQQQPVAPLCTGTGCQGIPSAPPIFATPSSVTFEGVGNFPAPAKETKVKPTSKKKAKPKKKKSRHKKKKSKAKKSAHKADSRKRSGSKGGRS